jgi:flagellar biosynthetic protein FlhB
MAEQDDFERTLPPTAKRIRDAREEGQVNRSRELATFALLAGGGLTLVFGSAYWNDGLARVLRSGLEFDRRLATDPALLAAHLLAMLQGGLVVALPLLAVGFFSGMAGTIAIGGWNFSTKAFGVRLGRLDPLKGLANMVSLHGANELIKAVLKAAAVGTLTFAFLWLHRAEVAALAAHPFPAGLAEAGALIRSTYLWLLGVVALIAAFDVPMQIRNYLRKLRMTPAEVRKEHKETEGDPQIKGRIRRIQRERARRRMMSAIPTADVVVTNPTHYAVALAYDDAMAAPQVVAKGSDELAARIREIARDAGVPIVEAPALARALHRHTEVGDPIPRALFEAVAILLAYVFQLREALAGGRGLPAAPTGLPVPPSLDPASADGDARAGAHP